MDNTTLIKQLEKIRRESWIVLVNNGWGELHATGLAYTIYNLCVEIIGKEENDKR